MSLLKTILIDDEHKVLEVLRIKLEKHCPQVEIVGSATDVNSGKNLIAELKPDLVFLDISMPDGTGLDLLSEIEHRAFKVIFCTGYSEYAVQAFKLSAVDYLLKPVKTNELIRAVQEAQNLIEAEIRTEQLKNLVYNLEDGPDETKRIAIPGQNEYEFVAVNDIVHCEGWEKYTKIHLQDGRTLVSSYNIGRFRENLDGLGFYTCHKSHLVNKSHILKYLTEGTLVMSNGASVPVSRRKRESFIEEFVKK